MPASHHYRMASPASTLSKKRLRELRKARGWTQEQAAEVCGVGYKLFQLYEIGVKQNPGLLTLEKLARGFGITLAELLTPSGPPDKAVRRTRAGKNN
jgi:transcriptional regulator with XRE-family HTH domain